MRDKAIRETLWKIIKLETGRNERGRIYIEKVRERKREDNLWAFSRGTIAQCTQCSKSFSDTADLPGNKREGMEKKKGEREKKKEWNKRDRWKEIEKGQTDVKRNRTIVNPDVLSCQDVVSGADMTQMESRALTTRNNREKYRASPPLPCSRLYALYALKRITLESSTRRRPIKSFDLAFVRPRVVAKLSPIYIYNTRQDSRHFENDRPPQLSPNNRKLIRAPLLLTSVKKKIKKNFQITIRASSAIIILWHGMERLENLKSVSLTVIPLLETW